MRRDGKAFSCTDNTFVRDNHTIRKLPYYYTSEILYEIAQLKSKGAYSRSVQFTACKKTEELVKESVLSCCRRNRPTIKDFLGLARKESEKSPLTAWVCTGSGSKPAKQNYRRSNRRKLKASCKNELDDSCSGFSRKFTIHRGSDPSLQITQREFQSEVELLVHM